MATIVQAPPVVETTFEDAYNDVNDLAIKAEAYDGLNRLTLLKNNRSSLSSEAGYRLLNPSDFEAEVEAHYARKAIAYHNLRNIFAILPLILTWASLSVAIYSFQQYLASPPPSADVSISFIALWQSGFGGRDPLTFVLTGLIDVILLLIYVALQYRAQRKETVARSQARHFVKKQQVLVHRILLFTGSSSIFDSTQNLPDFAKAIQNVIDHSLDQSMEQTSAVMKTVSDQLNALINDYREEREKLQTTTGSLIGEMRGLIDNIGKELSEFTSQLNRLAPASIQVVESVSRLGEVLKTYADDLTRTGRDLTARFLSLDGSIAALQASQEGTTQQLYAYTGTIAALGERIQATAGNLTETAEAMRILYSEVSTDMRPMLTRLVTVVTDSAQKQGDMAVSISDAAKSMNIAANAILTHRGAKPARFPRWPSFLRREPPPAAPPSSPYPPYQGGPGYQQPPSPRPPYTPLQQPQNPYTPPHTPPTPR